jgi:hypothetical protein
MTAGALFAPAVFAGCYTYSVIDVAGAKPGTEVRARLSMTAATQLGPSLGMSDARLLSGAVVDNQRDGLTLKVPTVPAGTVGAPDGLFQQILINRSDLLELESKQLDRSKTRFVVGAVLVGAAATTMAISRGGRSTGEPAVNEPPANFSLGAFGLRLSPRLVVRPKRR